VTSATRGRISGIATSARATHSFWRGVGKQWAEASSVTTLCSARWIARNSVVSMGRARCSVNDVSAHACGSSSPLV
jgi:hypothetical protein